MSLVNQYLRRSQEIIGDRTESEELYDNEVVKWLREGLSIRKAINRANERYPDEALKLDEEHVEDVAAHYEYLMQHMEILQKMERLEKMSGARRGQRRKRKRKRQSFSGPDKVS
jgi:hypothetical protein